MRRTIAALCATSLLALTACTDSQDPLVETEIEQEASASPDPRGDAIDQIADLPDVNLSALDLPEVPEGLDEADVLTAADTVRAMAVDAFTNRLRWTAEPGEDVLRSHLAIGGTGLYDTVRSSPVLEGPDPVSQLFVSSFAPEDQPLEQPRIVKAAWQVQEVEGDDGPEPMVTLEVQALYSVGDVEEPRAILMRRTIGIGGDDITQREVAKEWFVDVSVVGANQCRFLSEGLIARGDAAELDAFATFLDDAQTEEPVVEYGPMTPIAQLRDEACQT